MVMINLSDIVMNRIESPFCYRSGCRTVPGMPGTRYSEYDVLVHGTTTVVLVLYRMTTCGKCDAVK
jgi:hypothetical protein